MAQIAVGNWLIQGRPYGALYRQSPAAWRVGAVFDQCALDVLSAGNRGVGRGGCVSGTVARGRRRSAEVGLPGLCGGRRACRLVLDGEGLVHPVVTRKGVKSYG